MALLETALLSAAVPALIDMGKSLFSGVGRRIGGLSIDDQIKLQNADIERIKALASMDSPIGNPSQWVVDLRASFRYIAAGVSITIGSCAIWFASKYANASIADIGLQLVAIPYGFVFGERLLLNLKGSK